MAINWPTWIEDATNPPAALLVPCKKFVWLSVAIEKMRLLHNGIWKWQRSESMSAEEESCVAEEFTPGNWPLSYPADTPTAAQARDWIDTYWQPRETGLQQARGQLRRAIPLAWFTYVDLHEATI